MSFTKQKDDRKDKLDAIIELIVAVLGKEENQDPTIAECIASLRQITDIQETSRLFLFAVNSFRVQENREIWMALEENGVRIRWLNMLMVDEEKNQAPTIAECFATLRQIPDIQGTSRLFLSAINSFRVKENREAWTALEKNDVHIQWLNMLMEDGSR